MIKKFLFVYNANSGKHNALLDVGHKLLSPSTYNCNLCSLTHGILKEKKEWLRFRESVSIPFEFLHKDEFLKKYNSKWLPKYSFPILLIQRAEEIEVGITTEKMNALDSIDKLIDEVKKLI
ncbi:GTPase [Dokdonia sp. Hel_I_53]|uniref:GTPase n=1 Tax=Dokdonia sp. Hel_I_53 TaxID=1566287 RepID=UPI00119C62C8|nr:GTPase [Dokdonia sp. Hel_I_53]TVZ52005.1 hypothetical protein OD90_1168 [Dokdonia sp. Hel_I_53]